MPPQLLAGEHHIKVEKSMRNVNLFGKLALTGILCIMAVALASQGALAADEQAKVIFAVT
jgi:hypothetical protein